MSDARAALTAAAAARGESLAALSQLLGRNLAYLQQFVSRGSPRVLPERDRAVLADYLGISEQALGAPPRDQGTAVPRLDVAASAGPGAHAEDRLLDVEHFPAGLLRRHRLDGRALSMIVARGTSMEPAISDGDEMLVDTGDRRLDARGGVFVLRLDSALIVKRLRLVKGQVEVTSDNPDARPIAPLATDRADIVGRVVWLSRRL